MLQTQMQTSTGKMRVTALELARVLVRFNHIASRIVNANHCIMCEAVKL